MEGEPITREEYERLQKLLEETLSVSKENNYFLQRMRFWGRVAFWAKAVVWAIVLISPFVLFSYFAPYLMPFMKLLPGGMATSSSLFGYPAPAEVLKSVHN